MFVSILSGFSHSFWGNHPSLQVGSPKNGILGKNCAARDVLDGKTALLNKITSTVLEERLIGSAAFIEKVALSHKRI